MSAHPTATHAHHFPNAEVQSSASRMGVWLFLVNEILLFGGLFVAYFVFRSWYFSTFVEAHHHLDKTLGALNTVVLLTSSLTMALAVRWAKMGDRTKMNVALWITLACAAAFMVVKTFEYSHKIHEGLLPGQYFSAQGFNAPHGGIFFAIYFVMTGIHGFHILIGMGLILWVFLAGQRRPVGDLAEGVGLYWHLVDLIWIYLFPLLYLVG